MRASGWLVGLVVVALLVGCGGDRRGAQMRFADGSSTQLEHWQGRWVLINYWAEWCAPCREEIPELNRLHAERNRTGTVVLGVNFDGLRGARLEQLIQEMDVRFPVLVEDPAPLWEQPRPAVLPSTLVIGPDGALRKVLQGPQTYETLSHATAGITST